MSTFIETANEVQGRVYAPAKWPSDLEYNRMAIGLQYATNTYEPSRNIAVETIGHVQGNVDVFKELLGNRNGTNAPASTYIRDLIDKLTLIADSVDDAELWLEMRRDKAKLALQPQPQPTAPLTKALSQAV